MRRPILRINQFIPNSLSNGPGRRCVIWVQGCTLACPGCFNPETHSFQTGTQANIDILADRIMALHPAIEGITLSGGEPFQQAKALSILLEQIKLESNLSILAFSGYTLAELRKIPHAETILSYLDVLIAGRFVAEQRLAAGLIGSVNKEIHLLTSRYSIQDLQDTPEAEIIIQPDGEILLSGIDPIQWQ